MASTILMLALAGNKAAPAEPDTSVDLEKSLVQVACVEQAFLLQGFAHLATDGRIEELPSDRFEPTAFEQVKRPTFRLFSSGAMVIEYDNVPAPLPHTPFKLVCIGSLQSRTFTKLVIDGRLYSPKAGVSWEYENFFR